MLLTGHVRCDTGSTKLSEKPFILAGVGLLTLATVATVAGLAYRYAKKIEDKKAQSSEKHVIVIDFDRCLMKEHMYSKYKHTPTDEIAISEKDFGLDSPKTALNALLSDQANYLAIASFGRADIINKALDQVIEKKHRDKVIVKTPKDIGGQDGVVPDPPNKNAMIVQIMKASGAKPENTIFFDDTDSNLTDAKALGIITKKAAPFNEGSLQVVNQFIGKK
ncbi:MAG: hypothetical protein OXE99_13415 [Cellvibrionales bacterium]|nr:hypothetical protein [Cellvibrionales bacterium]